ncbi:5,10-methylenetetrahydrofolate reductase [Desulfovibrionales bacterium]
MRIIELMREQGQFISLEFFPPKEREKWREFFQMAEQLAVLKPLFVSVTYGAGGSTQSNTLELVTKLRARLGVVPMAHLTCMGANRGSIQCFLDSLVASGVDNVLALRGDPPQGQMRIVSNSEEFQHALDLVLFIRQEYPQLGIGVAAYPEKHPEIQTLEDDLGYLKLKLDMGADFAITQLFFDNRHYFEFVARARARGISRPIVPGILPILSLVSLRRIMSFCNVSLPGGLLARLEAADAAGGTAAVAYEGIGHAREQVLGLLYNGAPGVHLYTLNKVEACLDIVRDIEVYGRAGVY